jgi:undecaprenyl-diphosphatase
MILFINNYNMEIFQSIILGVVQGLTDFLQQQVAYGLAFDAVLQLATTLAIIVYFHKDIWKIIKKFFSLFRIGPLNQKKDNIALIIIIGTIPAVVLGLLLENTMDTVFRNPMLVSGTLIFGALIMYLAENKWKKDHLTSGSEITDNIREKLTIKKGLLIGLFQSLALIPGMSRSGMTIAGGLFSNLGREQATRFSFLLATPVLLGSGIKKFLDLQSDGILNSVGIELLWGTVAAFIVGLLAIHFLIKYLKNHTLKVFVWYRVVLAILILLIL